MHVDTDEFLAVTVVVLVRIVHDIVRQFVEQSADICAVVSAIQANVVSEVRATIGAVTDEFAEDVVVWVVENFDRDRRDVVVTTRVVGDDLEVLPAYFVVDGDPDVLALHLVEASTLGVIGNRCRRFWYGPC